MLGIKPEKPLAELLASGVRAEGNPAAAAAIIDLVTPDQVTEYWAGFQNFYVITRYNRSSFYAMSVFQLAEAIREQKQAL
jgi:membrane-bound lytic murein transglycosylase B